ncbi:hypothetical protein MtrunA17_Chr1g0213871 [Medicago truncatula]|uniref:Transmembrane protein n=1 Tax=Medicago truncatula TaxID=3880 RepID=A0A396JWU3_MEDTR|nr:hypothetical protein MtrunA17_Chr1g0213871 [Medicago truncatula]
MYLIPTNKTRPMNPQPLLNTLPMKPMLTRHLLHNTLSAIIFFNLNLLHIFYRLLL